ncbi:MAG: hypothetical protein JWM53_802 [bacterium]|nr:hypothetical protein [bacterium]
MLQLDTLIPALGASGQGQLHNWWWVILAVVVFAFVTPLAYLFGHGGGRPDRH